MPFYEYSCKKCGMKFDLMRRLVERDDPASCPSCGAKNAHRELPRIHAGVRDAAPSCDASSCPSRSFG